MVRNPSRGQFGRLQVARSIRWLLVQEPVSIVFCVKLNIWKSLSHIPFDYHHESSVVSAGSSAMGHTSICFPASWRISFYYPRAGLRRFERFFIRYGTNTSKIEREQANSCEHFQVILSVQ